MNNLISSYKCLTFACILFQGLWVETIAANISCGNAKLHFESCFLNDPANITIITAFSKYKNNIPTNKQEIQEYCKVFDQGLQCYNEYVESCLIDPSQRRLIEGEVQPAKNFYKMLCKDNSFKKDYLQHKDCFRHIEKDWTICTQHFRFVLVNEFTRTEREEKSNIETQQLHFCCARYSYELCVGNSARAKCKPESAKFTRNLVELLSRERQFKECGKFEALVCSTGNSIKQVSLMVFLIKIFIQLLFI